MKVKLLKKVRKRFEINHYPKGIVIYNEFNDYNLFELRDSNYPYITNYAQLHGDKKGKRFVDEIFETEVECINYLKSRIIKRLKSEGYKQRKTSGILKSKIKVWYV